MIVLGTSPIITRVDHWPSQEDDPYQDTVPSVLLYDVQGKLVACGAEAVCRYENLGAEGNVWSYVENFGIQPQSPAIVKKCPPLRCSLTALVAPHVCNTTVQASGLPRNVDLRKAYADYLSYLLAHTRHYLLEYSGLDLWSQHGNEAEVLFTHPDDWGVPQQHLFRSAAIAAGLIPEHAAQTRLLFLEESEASLSFCMATNPELVATLKKGSRFIVCDAGSSKAAVSSYRVEEKRGSEMVLAKISSPLYIDGGSDHIDARFESFLLTTLRDAGELGEKDIQRTVSFGLRDFRRHGKRVYSHPLASCPVRVGGRRMNSHVLPLVKGVLTLDGYDILGHWAVPSSDALPALPWRSFSNPVWMLL